MGSGASAGLAAATNSATDEDLKATLAGLSADERKKLQDVLASLCTEASTSLPPEASTSPPEITTATLLEAVEKKNAEQVAAHLQVDDVDVNQKDNRDNTPLMVAAKKGLLEICEKLLQVERVSVSDTNKCDRHTALQLAARNDNTEVVKLFLTHPSKREAFLKDCLNHQDVFGYTSLHQAAVCGQTEIARLLLKESDGQFSVNARDSSGNTALMGTALAGSKEIAALILEVDGIDINIKNDAGESALNIATKNNQTEIVEMLEKRGAE